jgi:hypothetical protein
MNPFDINDVRLPPAFKGITFSQFKKTDAKKELVQALYAGKVEPACYWSAEMVCAGHFADLWDILVGFFAQHVHLGHPKLASYLDLRAHQFQQIAAQGFADQELRMRNHPKVRVLFAEAVCILCDARKLHAYSGVKIKPEDFDLTYMTERFQAPSTEFAEAVFLPDDPPELFIPANELAYHLSEAGRNSHAACYWMEWMVAYEGLCKRRKEKCKCERRVFAAVESKSQMDPVWIIWDVLLRESESRPHLTQKLVQSALNLFCMRYTPGSYKKRRMLLYFAVRILAEPYDADEPLVRDPAKVRVVTQRIDKIYRQVKKQEHSPNTDYLYNHGDGSSLQRTIAKLETMNSLGEDFVPRTAATADEGHSSV